MSERTETIGRFNAGKADYLSDPRFQGLTPSSTRIWLSSPTMHGDEQRWVDEALQTNWVSTVGANIDAVEKGLELFESLGESVVSTVCSIDDIPDGNMCLSKSPQKGENRELFFKDLGKKSFGYIFYRYVLHRKIRTVLSKMHLK